MNHEEMRKSAEYIIERGETCGAGIQAHNVLALLDELDALRWTSETPKADGWYWWMLGGKYKPHPVLVEDERGMWMSDATCDEGGFCSDVGGLWCGPIAPPEVQEE